MPFSVVWAEINENLSADLSKNWFQCKQGLKSKSIITHVRGGRGSALIRTAVRAALNSAIALTAALIKVPIMSRVCRVPQFKMAVGVL